ncbi:MAG: hypothetical protein KDA89_02910 [Planctomycetaceae bacterium]|nr:hypothetical protein [Planctomycetaceae bacterium]
MTFYRRIVQTHGTRRLPAICLTTVCLTTVCLTSVAFAQTQPRLSNRDTEFRDLNDMMNPGTSYRSLNPLPQVDLSHVDPRVARNLLTESVTESERLYRSLQQDYQRYPEIRPLLSQLLTLRAQASRAVQDLDAGVALDRLLSEFQQLDSDWQLLSHQLSQTRILSNASRDSANRIDRLGRELEKLFKMEPQLDRRELLTQLANLQSSVRNLVEELELDTTGNQQTFDLVLEARKLDQQAYRVQQMVLGQYEYFEIVSEYNRFSQMWSNMQPGLRRLDNRYVERTIRNIMITDGTLHNLLWLEQQSNREHLKLLADNLMRDVDEFFNRTPLKLLLHFRDVTSLLQTSNDFYGTVQNMKDCVNRNESDETLRDCYRYVEQYGTDFIRTFEPLRSQAAKVVLRAIEDGILAMRNELNLAGTVTTIDTRALLVTAASLENLADHLDYDVQQWMRRDSQSFRNQVLQPSARFLQRSQRIHRMLEARPTTQELQRETSDLYEEWRTLYSYLGRCNTEERQHLLILSRDISEAIYNLRTPLQI